MPELFKTLLALFAPPGYRKDEGVKASDWFVGASTATGFAASIATGFWHWDAPEPLAGRALLAALFLPYIISWSEREWGFDRRPGLAIYTLIIAYGLAWIPVACAHFLGRWLSA